MDLGEIDGNHFRFPSEVVGSGPFKKHFMFKKRQPKTFWNSQPEDDRWKLSDQEAEEWTKFIDWTTRS